MTSNKILVIDDEPHIRFSIHGYLETQGFDVVEADSCKRARELASRDQFDAAVIDYMLPDGNALDLLSYLKDIDPSMSVIIMTGYGSIELAVRAVKEGADQFLTKPLEMPALQVIIERMIENRRNRHKQLAGRSRDARSVHNPFLGHSEAIRELARHVQRVAASDSPILISGDTGCGKGVLARWIHDNSPRAPEAFVDLNCAGLSRDLLESELFGYSKGAFTGAVKDKLGLLEVGHRGTVFLDEIGDVDPLVQPKLLKVLEDQRFRRLGDVRDRRVDIRLLAATHKNLHDLVETGTFRSDLYFRINIIPLRVPALRERPEDIGLLARHLLRDLCATLGHGKVVLTERAEGALRGYEWPGNIRELRNVLERAILLSDATRLDAEDLRFDQASAPPIVPSLDYTADMTLLEVERAHIERVLRAEDGHVPSAARRLGVPRSSLYQKIKRYGITRD